MSKPAVLLLAVLLAVCALPAGNGKVPALLVEPSPSFDVMQVVRQARNRVRAEGDALVAENADHRAEFTAAGLRYLPKVDAVAIERSAFSCWFETARAGQEVYRMAPASPVIAEANRVEYERGEGIVEAYLALDAGVEQLFVLNEPLAAGELTLVGHIETGLDAQVDPSGGLRFLARGQEALRYGQAVAVDAAGAQVSVETRLRAGELTLVVPGQWLATAAYPVTVDPFIGGDILISRAEGVQTLPSLAYNDDDNEWLVVWHDTRDGDFDIYGQRVDGNGTIQGDAITIWDSGDDLLDPAVAYDTKQSRYFVVWQNDTHPAIEGRVLNADGTFLTSELSITSGTLTRTHPDVAYNPVTNEYRVVWEHEVTATNHDVWVRKVSVDGVVDVSDTDKVSELASDEHTPALIAFPATSAIAGRYLVVWSNNISGTYNIVGRRLLSDGSPTGPTFGISTGTDGGTGDEFFPDLALDISSDLALVVWEYRPADGDQAIYGRLVDIGNLTNPRGTSRAISDRTGDQYGPTATYDSTAGEYLVIWDDGDNLHGQRLDGAANLVEDALLISAAQGGQWFGAAACGTASCLVVWGDYRSGSPDVFGQRLSRTDGLLGYEIGLSTTYSNQQHPALAYGSAQQRWLVVWEDDHTMLRGITGQFVARDGQLVGEPMTIGAHVNGQYSPAVAYNPDDDEFMVIWNDWRNLNHDIYGQRVKASDGSLSAEVQISSNTDWQWYPDIAYDGDAGQYLVVWSDKRNDPGDGTNWDIYGKRLKQDGTPWDGFFLDICKRPGNQEEVAVAYNPDQRQYLVIWQDSSLSGGGIAGQRIGDGSAWRVDLDNFDICSGDNQARPSVACNTTAGEYLVVWDNGFDISGQRLAGDRSPLGSAIAISSAAGGQRYPHASYDPSQNRYYVCWADSRSPTASWDIYGQPVSGGGSLLFTTADTNVPVWTYTGMQEYPAAAGDPADGRGLVVWQDMRNGISNNIYGRLGDPADLPPADLPKVFLPIVVRN